jgi:hypothetical protein
MKGSFIFLFFSFVFHHLNAQYVKPYYREDEKSVKINSEKKNRKFVEASKRKLLVVLNEEDPKKTKEFQKSEDKLNKYLALIRLTNKLLVDLIPKYWRQNNCQVEFKNYSECLALKKSGSKDYFTIDFSSLRQSENISGILGFSDPAIARANLLKKPGEFGKFEISLIEKFGKDSFYDFATIISYPNELDFIIGIQQINNFFLAKYANHSLNTMDYEGMIMEKHPYLSSRSLLIDSMQINFGNGFNMNDLKENYPYTFTLSSSDKILEVIKTADSTFAYLAIIPSLNITGKDNSFSSTAGGGMNEIVKDYVSSYIHYIIDAGSSEAIFFAKNQPRTLEKQSWQLNIAHILKLYNMKIVK